MSVVQLNVWICERCGKVDTVSAEVSPYDDPVVNPPTGLWRIDSMDKLVCGECPPPPQERPA